MISMGRGCKTPAFYSSECVEEEFCEVRSSKVHDTPFTLGHRGGAVQALQGVVAKR
jgi:hypothetical protein